MLRVEAISKSFGGLRAVSDCSFTVPKTQITGLVGPNGAGKTTVFNLITGTLPVDAGRILLDDQDITALSPQQRVGCGIARTFQDVRLFAGLSALDNVLVGVQEQPGESFVRVFTRPLAVRRHTRESRAFARQCLEFVGFPASRLGGAAGEFSYAEQKLISLARLLATRAKLLLLDEPASGLDETTIEHFSELLRQLVREGRTILLVEHNMMVVRELADWVVFLGAGTVAAEDVPERVLEKRELQEAYFGVSA
jgi:branched-chain amino acid transport system permease protein